MFSFMIAEQALDCSHSLAYLLLPINVMLFFLARSICSGALINSVVFPMSSPFNKTLSSFTVNDFMYLLLIFAKIRTSN